MSSLAPTRAENNASCQLTLMQTPLLMAHFLQCILYCMIGVHVSVHRYKMFDILKNLGKNAVTWDSTFQTGMTMPSNSVVHDYQGGNASVAKIAKAGVKVIVSSLSGMCACFTIEFLRQLAAVSCVSQCWQRFGSSKTALPLWSRYVAAQDPWTEIFTEEIMPSGLTQEEEKNVLGGATAMYVCVVCVACC